MSKTNHPHPMVSTGRSGGSFFQKRNSPAFSKFLPAQSKTGSLNDDFHICVSVRDWHALTCPTSWRPWPATKSARSEANDDWRAPNTAERHPRFHRRLGQRTYSSNDGPIPRSRTELWNENPIWIILLSLDGEAARESTFNNVLRTGRTPFFTGVALTDFRKLAKGPRLFHRNWRRTSCTGAKAILFDLSKRTA